MSTARYKGCTSRRSLIPSIRLAHYKWRHSEHNYCSVHAHGRTTCVTKPIFSRRRTVIKVMSNSHHFLRREQPSSARPGAEMSFWSARGVPLEA